MMAFLAMMIAALATINQLTEQIKSFDETLRGEYELMANVIDPVRKRMAKNLADNLLTKQREAVKRTLERFDEGVAADVESSSKLNRGNK
jgi:hypothetical protein